MRWVAHAARGRARSRAAERAFASGTRLCCYRLRARCADETVCRVAENDPRARARRRGRAAPSARRAFVARPRSRLRVRGRRRAGPLAARSADGPRERRQPPRGEGRIWNAEVPSGRSPRGTKIPPVDPVRTASTPASASTRTASRSVARLICIAAARSRSEGSRSPAPSSPRRICSAICSTAPSNVRRGPTGTKALSTSARYAAYAALVHPWYKSSP